MAVTISCRNWNTLRQEVAGGLGMADSSGMTMSSSGPGGSYSGSAAFLACLSFLSCSIFSCFSLRAFSLFWTFTASSSLFLTLWASLSPAKTSGGSVCPIRFTPPWPKCFLVIDRILNCTSVSGLFIMWTRRATRVCSSLNSARAASSASSFSGAPDDSFSSSLIRGVMALKSFSSFSTLSSDPPENRVDLTNMVATCLLFSYGKYVSSSEYCCRSSTCRAREDRGIERSSSTSATEVSSRDSDFVALRTEAHIPRQ
mmetsp:Transcript_12427/g.22639  ORF Transcript_12427/g.22639 Transcript_12427/m.22639 type:complete len:257 (+) Transcript_12427:694-1464(+)